MSFVPSTGSASRRGPLAAVRSVAAVFAVAAAALVAVATPALASSDGCTYGGYPVDRCEHVQGSGTYVNYVTGTITYRTGQYLEIEMWGDGFYYRGHGDVGTPSDTTRKTITLNRNLANGSYVCTAARWTDGTQVSPVCLQIHS